MYKKLLIVFAVLLMGAAFPGCSHSNNKLAPGEPSYAEGITETMLEALSSGDYQSYSMAFNAEMAQMTPESVFSDYRGFIQSKIGVYKSKKFSSAKADGDKNTVTYIAKFTKEPKDVVVTIIFQVNGDKISVADFWLNSPKMWENKAPA